jgi:hypothetical protein
MKDGDFFVQLYQLPVLFLILFRAILPAAATLPAARGRDL